MACEAGLGHRRAAFKEADETFPEARVGLAGSRECFPYMNKSGRDEEK